MDIGIISLFPEMFALQEFGVIGRALKQNIVNLHRWNPRDYTHDKYKTVDDRPFGGGPGMLMKAPPLHDAIQVAKQALPKAPLIYASPQGKRFDQKAAEKFSKYESIIFLAGRYEGIDERIIERDIDEEWSIGDYVLTGGELPIIVMIEAMTRLLPGTLGKQTSTQEDSFSDGLLDCPHYTRPETFNDLTVPAILRTGNHAAITQWRLKQSLGKTWLKRPDLLKKRELSRLEQQLLEEFQKEHQKIHGSA